MCASITLPLCGVSIGPAARRARHHAENRDDDRTMTRRFPIREPVQRRDVLHFDKRLLGERAASSAHREHRGAEERSDLRVSGPARAARVDVREEHEPLHRRELVRCEHARLVLASGSELA